MVTRPQWVKLVVVIPPDKLHNPEDRGRELDGWSLVGLFHVDGPREPGNLNLTRIDNYEPVESRVPLFVLTHLPTGAVIRTHECPAVLFEMAAFFLEDCDETLLACGDPRRFAPEMESRYQWLRGGKLPPWVLPAGGETEP